MPALPTFWPRKLRGYWREFLQIKAHQIKFLRDVVASSSLADWEYTRLILMSVGLSIVEGETGAGVAAWCWRWRRSRVQSYQKRRSTRTGLLQLCVYEYSCVTERKHTINSPRRSSFSSSSSFWDVYSMFICLPSWWINISIFQFVSEWQGDEWRWV